jgi:ribosomal protein S18 acetylase RimI-like enzyme
MSDESVVIGRGLPEHLRADAARLFREGFGDKLRMAVPDTERQQVYLEQTLDGSHMVVALMGDELVGMMGLSSSDGSYRGGLLSFRGTMRELRPVLGLWGSIRAVGGSTMAHHRPAPGELYIDGIVVAASARSQGIGGRLLDEALAIAREGGLRWLRLHVIDTNPRAQRLYERLGYRVTDVQSFRYLRRFTGFGAIVAMELSVDAEAVSGGARPG